MIEIKTPYGVRHVTYCYRCLRQVARADYAWHPDYCHRPTRGRDIFCESGPEAALRLRETVRDAYPEIEDVGAFCVVPEWDE